MFFSEHNPPHFHVDYQNMDDEQFAEAIAQIDFCMKKTGQYNK